MKTSQELGKGITVTVRDREKNNSKSFTVYSDDFEKIFEILRESIKKAK